MYSFSVEGSNLLVSDRGFDGVVVSLGDQFGVVEVDFGLGRVDAGGALHSRYSLVQQPLKV